MRRVARLARSAGGNRAGTASRQFVHNFLNGGTPLYLLPSLKKLLAEAVPQKNGPSAQASVNTARCPAAQYPVRIRPRHGMAHGVRARVDGGYMDRFQTTSIVSPPECASAAEGVY